MSDRKLFAVEIQVDVIVLATDMENARYIVRDNKRQIFDDCDYNFYTSVSPVITPTDLPREWNESIPYIDEDYDGEDELNDLTCAEVFQTTVEARQKAEKDRKDKELEAKLQVNIFSNDLKKAEAV